LNPVKNFRQLLNHECQTFQDEDASFCFLRYEMYTIPVITITTAVMADHAPNATKSNSAMFYLLNGNKINTLEMAELHA